MTFLPGEGEIRRVAARLANRLPDDVVLRSLFGAMPFGDQRKAIQPEPKGRKLVLATSIAETSLTIEDIRVVVDGGKARRARFDPGSGMSRLITERVTRAEAAQRAGRAGRVAPGTAYRLWAKGEEGALSAYPPAEIESADLTSLVLELALWGAGPAELPFLSRPPEGAFAEAQALLRMLGALDDKGQITRHGRQISSLPLHPRLAHMLHLSGKSGAEFAALLSERDLLTTSSTDLNLRLEAVQHTKRFAQSHDVQIRRAPLDRIKKEAQRLEKMTQSAPSQLSPGEMAALAYPDRIGLRRKGDAARYQLSGGKGAIMDDGDTLAGQRLIVVTDTDGNPREARIRQAVSLTLSELRDLFADQIHWRNLCRWNKRDRRVEARTQEMFGDLVLDDRIWKDAPSEEIGLAMLDGVRDLGLTFSDASRRS